MGLSTGGLNKSYSWNSWCVCFGRGVLWKEVRQLQTVFWGFLLLQILLYLILFFSGPKLGWNNLTNRLAAGDVEAPVLFGLAGVWLSLGMLGTLFFSLENEENTASFLFRLPVERWVLFRDKILAAAIVWVALLAGSTLLFLVVLEIWAPLAEMLSLKRGNLLMPTGRLAGRAEWYFGMGLLSYPVCAFFSLRRSSALIAFLLGMAVTLLIALPSIMYQGASDRVYVWGNPASLVFYLATMGLGTAIAFVVLFYRFTDLEETRGDGFAEDAAPPRFHFASLRATSLWRVECRRKMALWIALLGLQIFMAKFGPRFFPSLIIDLNRLVGGPRAVLDTTSIVFPLVLISVLSGVTLWGRAELNGVGFWLHYLSISRTRVFFQRLGGALLLNVLALAVALFFLNLNGESERNSISFLFLNKSAAMEFGVLWILPFGQVVFLLAGAVFSPLRGSTLICSIAAAIAGCFIVIPTIIAWAGDPFGIGWACFMVTGGLLALAWWNNARSRALEPGVRKGWRLIGLALLMVAGTILVDLVDPLDLLYLLGLDVYRWF